MKMNIRNFIQQNEPMDNSSNRINCPECGGRNTFTITMSTENFFGIVIKLPAE